MSILGVLLGVSGAELAVTGVYSCSLPRPGSPPPSQRETKTGYFVMMITAVVIVGSGKTQYGVLAGLFCHLLYGDGIRQYRGMCRKETKEEEEEEEVREGHRRMAGRTKTRQSNPTSPPQPPHQQMVEDNREESTDESNEGSEGGNV